MWPGALPKSLTIQQTLFFEDNPRHRGLLLVERNAVVEIDDRGGGHHRIPNAPWKFSDAPEVGVTGTPRYRGEDNAEVLSEMLGLSDDEIARLADEGVLSSHLPRR